MARLYYIRVVLRLIVICGKVTALRYWHFGFDGAGWRDGNRRGSLSEYPAG